jgi:hypothetical protein
MVFHPRTVAVINPNVAGALGVCMTVGSQQQPRTVTSISPVAGPTAGGTPVIISGSNFQVGDTVTLGGVAARNVNVTGPGTLTAVTGAHPTGIVDVVVSPAGGGGAAGTLSGGYYYTPPPTTTGFYTVPPCRVVDTRNAAGPLGGPALAANQRRTFQIPGSCNIPSNAVSVSANLTVVAAGGGFIALYPGNAFPLGTSNLNFAAGQVRACNSVLMLSTDGTGTVGVLNGNSTAIQFILDVNGYFR